MNIKNIFTSLFKSPAASPLSQSANMASPSLLQSGESSKTVENEESVTSTVSNKSITSKVFINIFIKSCSKISKIFAGAIILEFFANLTPGLREQLPSFYKIVDFLISVLDWISSFIVNFF